jgi:hypothetical protein
LTAARSQRSAHRLEHVIEHFYELRPRGRIGNRGEAADIGKKRASAKRANRRSAEHLKRAPKPALAVVLAHVADGLRKSGAQIAPRALETLSAAMTFLAATKSPTDGDVA